MRTLTLFTVLALCVQTTSAQNTWDGSTTSTITTNGKVAIGTATLQNGYSLTVSNTLNTQANGAYFSVNNTYASDQSGVLSSMIFTGTAGRKYGFRQTFGSASPTDSYNMFLASFGSDVGNRMGLVSWMTPGTKVECGIYSMSQAPVALSYPSFPAEDRSAFFVGPVETVARADNEKVFIVNRRDLASPGFGTDVFRIYGNGKVYATEINVKLAANFPDYVFFPTYHLMPLNEVKNYIHLYGHLPNVPTAATVAEEGINIGEMNKVMMEKIEELTLYIIQQQAEIEALRQEMNALKQ